MGTKTGTAEKVAGEVCLHAELEHNRKHNCRGAKACRRALVGVHDAHRGPCYTSSMCVFGRVPGTEREILVLVVVDEPRGGKKFGAEVAGPAAIAVLEEALGTRARELFARAVAEGFAELEAPGAPTQGRELRGNPPRASAGRSMVAASPFKTRSPGRRDRLQLMSTSGS
jgi:hypothetical protein